MLAVFVNAITLVALSAWILYESWVRLMNPVPVDENAMPWVAGALVIRATGWMRIDPIPSVAIAVLVIWTAWDFRVVAHRVFEQFWTTRRSTTTAPATETVNRSGLRFGL